MQNCDFFLGGGGGGEGTHMHRVKNFPNHFHFIRIKSHMQKTFNLPSWWFPSLPYNVFHGIEKVVNDKETNWHGVIMLS